MMDDYMKEFYQLLNIPENELTRSYSMWRFNVLHVRGVDSLTSEDVYQYFQQKPHSIEWLSNISCNVTFECINEAYEALLAVSKGIILHKNDFDWCKVDSGVYSPLFNFPVHISDELEIPVPPNYRYIMGEKHAKAKSIIIRFATIHDRKVNQLQNEDAELVQQTNKRNQIVMAEKSISSSSNRALQRVKRNSALMEIDEDFMNDSMFTTRNSQQRSTKPMAQIRMRMRADEEEERIKNLRIQQRNKLSSLNRLDLRSRLSIRYGNNRHSSRKYLPRSLLNSSTIKKSRRNEFVWKRKIDDTMKNKVQLFALNASSEGESSGDRMDLRSKMNEPIIRVQVTYDDEILF